MEIILLFSGLFKTTANADPVQRSPLRTISRWEYIVLGQCWCVVPPRTNHRLSAATIVRLVCFFLAGIWAAPPVGAYTHYAHLLSSSEMTVWLRRDWWPASYGKKQPISAVLKVVSIRRRCGSQVSGDHAVIWEIMLIRTATGKSDVGLNIRERGGECLFYIEKQSQ